MGAITIDNMLRAVPRSRAKRPDRKLCDVDTAARHIFCLLAPRAWGLLVQSCILFNRMRPSIPQVTPLHPLPPSLTTSFTQVEIPVGHDNHLRITAMVAYASTRNPGVQLKFGSCFEDLLSVRPYNSAHYSPEYFDHDGVITGDAFDIRATDDIAGGLMESCILTTGRSLGHDINIRKFEGDDDKSSFARKDGDAVFSVDRPGSLYVVPSRYATPEDFKDAHVSYYKKRQAYTEDELLPSGRKKRKETKPRAKQTKPRAKETKPRKERADKGGKHKNNGLYKGRKPKAYTLPK